MSLIAGGMHVLAAVVASLRKLLSLSTGEHVPGAAVAVLGIRTPSTVIKYWDTSPSCCCCFIADVDPKYCR
jgi:hypothetical protein